MGDSNKKKFYFIDDKLDKYSASTVVQLNKYIISKYVNPTHAFSMALLISHVPMDDKKSETFFKLKNKNKSGFLYRYLVKCAVDNGVPKVYIDKYFRLKKLEKNENEKAKLVDIDAMFKTNSNLSLETKRLIIATIQRVNSKSDRQRKLDNIFLSKE